MDEKVNRMSLTDDVADDMYNHRLIADEALRIKALNNVKSHKICRERANSASSIDHSSHRKSSADYETGSDKSNLEEDIDEDVREDLFDAIPEPYIYYTDFQRVIISEANEPIDADTQEACRTIIECMKMREKYLGLHPVPPQDSDTYIKKAYDQKISIMSPKRASIGGTDTTESNQTISSKDDLSKGSPVGMRSSTKRINPDDYRRRPVPKYNVFERTLPDCDQSLSYEFVDGVFVAYRSATSTSSANDDEAADKIQLSTIIAFPEFVRDYKSMRQAIHSGPMSSYSYKRLQLLLAKFNLHQLLNDERETNASKSVPHRDCYNVRKVDTHVHHSACMNQKHLLRFIKHKLRHNPNEIVTYRDGKFLTLGEVFKSLHLTAYDLSIDTLDMHANNTFQRFDRFNLKYNPIGESRLREIFLKYDNHIKGKYIAEITREVMGDLEATKYQLAEWRISIYGRKLNEWKNLASWFYENRLSHFNIRWLIQVPRLFDVYHSAGDIKSFGELLYNFFQPLFDVTIDPSSNFELHYFLETIVGIDSVDDESKPEMKSLSSTLSLPNDWTEPENPPYAYWMYYFYANICVLNQMRACRGMCTFQFRPHCGEAGSPDHLISTYLVAHQINHGLLLRKNPALYYVHYLSQVGIAMSPLSNNKLFLDYQKNPFPKYFAVGMNVSLSTDDPLMLHYTKDALTEEYAVATQVWKFSSTDQCEIARNSVLQSGWEKEYKLHFLGKDLCDIKETNVSDIRLTYRRETLAEEQKLLVDYTNYHNTI